LTFDPSITSTCDGLSFFAASPVPGADVAADADSCKAAPAKTKIII
jgi:hypothetical protein